MSHVDLAAAVRETVVREFEGARPGFGSEREESSKHE